MTKTAILAVDPGTTQSAWLLWDGVKILEMNTEPNEEVLARLRTETKDYHLAVEMVASYGMAVGKEIFDTVLWIGRFVEGWSLAPLIAPSANFAHNFELIYRKDIKQHFCHSLRAKDANVRQALIDRFGGQDRAVGRKASKGPLYGVSKHLWSALAVAVYTYDQQAERSNE